jgi:hypothetical protein
MQIHNSEPTMQAAVQSRAQMYKPASPQALEAAQEYIDRTAAWERSQTATKTDLRDFLRSKVQAKALGFISTDSMAMSAYGIVFEEHPGPGFIAVPGRIADRVEAQGLRGQAYFPDTNTDLGKQVLARLNAVSRVAESRPLLSNVPGLSSVALQDNHRVVLSRAVSGPNGPIILAAPAAISAQASLTPYVASTASAARAPSEAVERPQSRKLRM